MQLGRFKSDGTIDVQSGGRQITVASGIPTETVRLGLSGSGKHWRGEVIAVLDAAPERTTPACPVVDSCGGCEWQHLNHEGQLKHKAAIVRRLLSAQRLPTRIDEIVPMPDPWRYRVRAQIALGARAGFRQRRAKRIVPLDSCPVVHPLIDRLLEQTNRLIRLGEVPDFGGKLLLHAQVVGEERERMLQLVLEAVDGLTPEEAALRATAAALAGQRGVESVSWLREGGEVVALEGESFSEIEVDGRDFVVPAGAFFQSNLQLLSRLLRHLRRLLDLRGGETLADIYGGIGLLGLSVADLAGSLRVIELNPVAIEAGRLTAARWELDNVEFVAAPAEEAVRDLPQFDRVIVDPPRTGLHREVVEALIARAPESMVYVSCNPATFARDAATLTQAGYQLDHLSLWDFYPQTVHVEIVAKLIKSTLDQRAERLAEPLERRDPSAAQDDRWGEDALSLSS
ncbi:MAG TPA: 23S rRNA (uracil(1939)-C(5))-methyltransferase RlmD [Thermomicrobiaceae bacterium]|nr:23S rRNA (uracil(1939)-C(5))-methyltransferase RlmD [Thermomicrobiaceae bacterium]